MTRVVVITGGSRGIGRALARACVERGMLVVTCARGEAGSVEGVVEIRADVTCADDVERLVATAIARFGRIDVLVNGAAIARGDFADVMATNASGAYACARAVLATNPGARVVNVSSGLVEGARAGAAAYIASKHALEGMTRAMALDYPRATIVAVRLGAHATTLVEHVGDVPPAEAALPALLEAMTVSGSGRVVEAAVGRPNDPTAPPFGGADRRAQVPAIDPTAPPFGGAERRAQVPAIDPTAPPFGGADRRAQVPAIDPTAPPFGGAERRAQVPAIDPTAPPFGGAERRAQVPAIDVSGADLLAHPLGPSPAVRAALAEYAARGAIERYAGAGSGLRKLLAANHEVPLDAIVLGAGASELIARVVDVFTRRGDRIATHAPSWPLFPHLANARGVVPIVSPYRLAGRRIDHDLDALVARLDRTVRLVYLVSPSNPMGCALDDEPFARFLAALPDDLIVVVDEAYGEFVTRPDAARAVAWTRRDPRVVALRTFSKFYALAGMRIGYAVAAPAVARRLEAAALPFAVTDAAQLAAVAALGDLEHARRTHALLARGRATHPDALDSDAPFALAPIPGTPRFFDGRYATVPLWPTDTTT